MSYRDEKCNYGKTPQGFPAVRLCNTWWDAQEVIMGSGGIEPLLLGMSSQIAEAEDAMLSKDVQGNMELSV